MAESIQSGRPINIWVLGTGMDDPFLERLGDARRVADAIGCSLGALAFGVSEEDAQVLIHRGADVVCRAEGRPGTATLAATTIDTLAKHDARLVIAPGDPPGREWASLVAVRFAWPLVSPALMVEGHGPGFKIAGLDATGRLMRTVRLGPAARAILTLRPGVGEAVPADPRRRGEIAAVALVEQPDRVVAREFLPADPTTVDIRYSGRLVAGGRGLGSREGFDRLRRFASRIGAGVAASRMAVDLGWIEYARQVGQTGHTVTPDLYIACGISGASHHLEGMSGARCIIAINTDPEAPIFRVAHLGLVADLHDVLAHLEEETER
ncbi:MAG: electron transfer flavoprotein subunit alpha/FixB family protein [Acidobacteria bacterium]|nr:electron transfer flavoprotein subunit alpha/FixB family protein [Acidobacteriota bacterium]